VGVGGARYESAEEDGVPPSLQLPPHTHILTDRSPAPYSLARPFSNGIFRSDRAISSFPCARPFWNGIQEIGTLFSLSLSSLSLVVSLSLSISLSRARARAHTHTPA